MKKHLTAILVEFIFLIICGFFFQYAWNQVVPELFHYKEITPTQSFWIVIAFRTLMYR